MTRSFWMLKVRRQRPNGTEVEVDVFTREKHAWAEGWRRIEETLPIEKRGDLRSIRIEVTHAPACARAKA